MALRKRELERRDRVERRAGRRCEYCRAPQPVTGVRYHLEHVFPESLGGTDDLDNLALACPMCNSHKSNHILGIDDQGSDDGQLFHPRIDRWEEHFDFDSETFEIRWKTKKGQGTVNRLRMNDALQIEARKHWVDLGHYP